MALDPGITRGGGGERHGGYWDEAAACSPLPCQGAARGQLWGPARLCSLEAPAGRSGGQHSSHGDHQGSPWQRGCN